jgi:hypothetical protein
MSVVQNPASFAALRVVVGEVDETALAVPHVLASYCNLVAGPLGDSLTDADVVDYQNRLSGSAANEETLVHEPAVGIREDL